MLRSKSCLACLTVLLLLGLLVGGYSWSVSVRWQFVGGAWSGDIRRVRRMLDDGMDPNIVSYIGGIRAISMAAHGGHIDVVRLLLDWGADPTWGLPQAISTHRVDIVRLLIKRGANVVRLPGDSKTPLQIAKEAGNAEIVSMLRQAGAKQ